MRRILIGGTNSGCGKTTITCAILAALKRRNLKLSAFKCGPDYIDPMFHKKIIDIPSYNLDSFFHDRNTLVYLLDHYGKTSDISIIEGVMGFYDGTQGSAYSISEITNTPSIIIVNCKGMSDSIGAIVRGFLNYKTNNIAGFIFNCLPEKLIPLAKKICSEQGTEYLGSFPKNEINFESRHLGLVTVEEISDIKDKIEKLSELAEQYIDLDRLISFTPPPLPLFSSPLIPHFSKSPIVAVAKDYAFCFIYQENLDLLKEMGCKIVFFSPINDDCVPDSDGLILFGGYPELYASELSQNTSMINSIKESLSNGKPTIAECGGFMYLHNRLTKKDGLSYEMVGAIDGNCYQTSKLQRFGYITLNSEKDNLITKKGEKIKAHEFHYWESSNCGNDFTAEKNDGRSWKCCHANNIIYAGFPHINFYSNLNIPASFIRKCLEFGETNV